MLKRFLLVFLTLIIAVVVVLLAARHPTGPNTVSYDEPAGLWMSIGMIFVLFIPPLIFSLFSNRIVKNISIVYQVFIVISFLGIVSIGFFVPYFTEVSVIALIGALVSIASIVVTLKAQTTKEDNF